MKKSGRLDFVGRALDPTHHGAGTFGNTQILRTQRIYSPTIERMVAMPYISGNSFKHMIRASAAKFALEAMAVEDGSLTKPVVHLLFSGGSLGKTSASAFVTSFANTFSSMRSHTVNKKCPPGLRTRFASR